MTTKQQALIEYSREIGPRVRDIINKKQIIKDFATTDQRAVEMAEEAKAASEAAKADLKKYIETENAELLEEIKELEKELTLAIKAAARATKGTDHEFKAGDLKPYFVARNKPFEQGKKSPVKKVIDKGDTFEVLESILGKDD
jgi:hypothetical protein